MKTITSCVTWLILSSSAALAYCSEPSAPYCASSYGPFSDQWEFDSCKYDMERFQRDVTDYAQCLSDEVEDLADEARRKINTINDELSGAIGDFNSRANQ